MFEVGTGPGRRLPGSDKSFVPTAPFNSGTLVAPASESDSRISEVRGWTVQKSPLRAHAHCDIQSLRRQLRTISYGRGAIGHILS